MNKVSIIIPTFKRPQLIINAIKSCLNQTYLPYEIVIGDDSPDELTKSEIQHFGKNCLIPIRYFHNKPSLGQARNMNMLFDSVWGDKTMLLHDDDLLLPEAVEILINCFNSNPDVRIAYGKQYIINDDNVILYEKTESYNTFYYRSKIYEGSVLTPLESGMGQQFPNISYLVDSEIIKKIQFRTHDSFGKIGNGCEYDFGVRLGEAGYKMYYVDKYVAMYRVSKNSMSGSFTGDAGFQAFQILKKIHPDTYFGKKIKKNLLINKAPIAITQAVNIGKKKEALEIYFSRWYLKKALSIGGIKRILYIFFYSKSLFIKLQRVGIIK